MSGVFPDPPVEIQTWARIGYTVKSMNVPDGPAQQIQRSTRWYVQRADGTWLDCGLEAAGWNKAIAMLQTYEANGQ